MSHCRHSTLSQMGRLKVKAEKASSDICLALLDYRNTPSGTTGTSPAQWLFGRRNELCCRLLQDQLESLKTLQSWSRLPSLSNKSSTKSRKSFLRCCLGIQLVWSNLDKMNGRWEDNQTEWIAFLPGGEHREGLPHNRQQLRSSAKDVLKNQNLLLSCYLYRKRGHRLW